MNKFKFRNIGDNLFKRLSDNEEVQKEIVDYFNEIITDWHSEDFDKINTSSLRNKIFLEHKDEIIDSRIDALQKENDELEKTNKELRKLSNFSITNEEQKQIKEWDKTHKCTLPKEYGQKYIGAIGGHLSYTFTPTGIGTFVKVRCACGEELKLDCDF